MDFKGIIRNIQDFPVKGVLFRDITPVLMNAAYLRGAITGLREMVGEVDFDIIAGPESRGFIFGVPLAMEMGKGFVPIRKAGKLPCATISKAYELEYGTATIEVHADAIRKGARVLLVDDLLATGGTCQATCELIEEAGGVVAACAFFIELQELGGRGLITGRDLLSLVKY